MATRGGLEIHLEMVHGAPKAPLVVPVVSGPIPATPQGAVPRGAIPAPRGPAVEWQLPTFLRGIDATLPLTALLVVALFLAGAAAAIHRSSSNGASAAAVQGAASAAAAPVPAVDPAADGKLAQSLVLTPTDYPDGWAFTPHANAGAQADNDRLLAACLGLPDPATTRTADAFGLDAHETQLLTGATRVVVFKTAQQASSELAAFGGAKAIPCLKDEVTRSYSGGGLTVTDVRIGRFALATGNIQSVAVHAEIALAKGTAGGTLHADVVVLQQGRVLGQAEFASGGGELPLDTEQTLVTRFAHKLANA